MAQDPGRELLRKVIGLEISSVGDARIDRAVVRRMAMLNLTDVNQYVHRLCTDEHELSLLVEEVVVPETWFFRDGEPFRVLASYVADKLSGREHGRPLKLLSVPCSTGEEPYSMAIALLDAGIGRRRFSIDAVDISARALERARQACYTEHAFREKGMSCLSKYFKKTPSGYQLCKEVCSKVRFVRDNVLSPTFLIGTHRYDIIFCRNLLIYLEEQPARQVMDTMERLLVTGGLMFVGHAETGKVPSRGFVPSQYPRSFSFFKRDGLCNQFSYNTFKHTISPVVDRVSCRPVRKPSDKPVAQRGPEGDARPASAGQDAMLEEARRLADCGQLQRAAYLCEEYLRNHGPSPMAYFILGVVYDASGDWRLALKTLQKAVYLQPDLYEALLLLSLMWERAGEHARAESFRKRAMRVACQTAD